ncbi:MAG TPA: sugar phosphate isomerase/epimerase [Terriglobia bacterium]|nr:sugar phosphate isomerase/epimerase [Terriglobia bacterium]
MPNPASEASSPDPRQRCSAGARPVFGLQLYTVRHALAKDLEGTLRQISAIGYREVELYSFFNRPASVTRRALQEAALTCPSGHYMLAELRSGLAERIANAQELGLSYMVCALLQPHERKGLDDYRRLADWFNQIGEQTQRAGLKFVYHCHNFEFTTYDGVTALDELLRRTNPQLVEIELDTYWVSRAGRDPAACLNKYPGRFSLLHLKDMKPGHAPTTDFKAGLDAFTEVGQGAMEWKRLLQAAMASGVKHYFVEQDLCERPQLESARISYQYLSRPDLWGG